MSSILEFSLISGAWALMEWLAQCAALISNAGQPVSWISPLGLPVVQPYRQVRSYQVYIDVSLSW